MALDLGDFLMPAEKWSLDGAQTADYNSDPILSGVPATVSTAERSSGITFNGVLDGVSATADSLFNTFGKFYSLNSKIEDSKFQRTVNEANQSLKVAETMGALDIKRATIDANIAIEKARAGRAVADQVQRIQSGSSYIPVPRQIDTKMLLLGGAALAAVYFFTKGGK